MKAINTKIYTCNLLMIPYKSLVDTFSLSLIVCPLGGKNRFERVSEIRILTRTPFPLKISNPNLNRNMLLLILYKSLIYTDLLSLIVSPLGENKQNFSKFTMGGQVSVFTTLRAYTTIFFLFFPDRFSQRL